MTLMHAACLFCRWVCKAMGKTLGRVPIEERSASKRHMLLTNINSAHGSKKDAIHQHHLLMVTPFLLLTHKLAVTRDLASQIYVPKVHCMCLFRYRGRSFSCAIYVSCTSLILRLVAELKAGNRIRGSQSHVLLIDTLSIVPYL